MESAVCNHSERDQISFSLKPNIRKAGDSKIIYNRPNISFKIFLFVDINKWFKSRKFQELFMKWVLHSYYYIVMYNKLTLLFNKSRTISLMLVL